MLLMLTEGKSKEVMILKNITCLPGKTILLKILLSKPKRKSKTYDSRKRRLRKQAGGGIPGNTDTVEAMLTPGEYVIRKDAVDAIRQDYGDEFLEILNHYDSKKRRK